MSKVVFFSIPAYGHTNPTLPLVEELVKRGEEVIYYSTDEFTEKILATGATYVPYSFSKTGDTSIKAGRDLAALYYLMIKITVDYIDDLIQEVEKLKPDYIIHDAICAWGRYVANVCDIPAISSVSTFALYEKGISATNLFRFFRDSGLSGIKYILKARKLQRTSLKKYGVQPRSMVETMMNEESLNIVYTSDVFQPHIEKYDSEKYAFIGPSITERKNDSDITDYSQLPHPMVYLSMGTVWKGAFDMDSLIRSFTKQGYSLVMAGVELTGGIAYGENVIVKKHINQIEVLKHCDVFITHGGMNSVNEALYWGVPLCLHPFQTEQAIVADRVVEFGCGLRINTLDTNTIIRNVDRLLKEKSFRKNSEKLGVSFREAGGVSAGVDRILEYAKRRHSI